MAAKLLTQAHNIHNKHLPRHRHEPEVHRLYRGPKHPILLQRLPIRSFQLLLWIAPFHDRHAAQEAKQIRRREDRLVRQHARRDRQVGPPGEIDVARQEGEPGCGGGAEDAAAVEGHAAGAGEVLLVPADFLDGLLGHGVAGCEEDLVREAVVQLISLGLLSAGGVWRGNWREGVYRCCEGLREEGSP